MYNNSIIKLKHDGDAWMNWWEIVMMFKFLMRMLELWFCRGNTPFCSKECREEQIEIDEAKEKSWKRSSKRGVRQSENNQNSTTNKAVGRTGTVAVAWSKYSMKSLKLWVLKESHFWRKRWDKKFLKDKSNQYPWRFW